MADDGWTVVTRTKVSSSTQGAPDCMATTESCHCVLCGSSLESTVGGSTCWLLLKGCYILLWIVCWHREPFYSSHQTSHQALHCHSLRHHVFASCRVASGRVRREVCPLSAEGCLRQQQQWRQQQQQVHSSPGCQKTSTGSSRGSSGALVSDQMPLHGGPCGPLVSSQGKFSMLALNTACVG